VPGLDDLEMKTFIAFAFGVLFGCFALFSIQKIKQFGEDFWAPTRIHESSQAAREKIQSSGINLPQGAYDLEYFFYAGRDYTKWVGFSAPNEKIESIIPAIIRGREFEKGTKGVPDKPEYWTQESTTGNWWPDSSKGLVTYNGDLFWIGHDTTRGRLYYYSFSM